MLIELVWLSSVKTIDAFPAVFLCRHSPEQRYSELSFRHRWRVLSCSVIFSYVFYLRTVSWSIVSSSTNLEEISCHNLLAIPKQKKKTCGTVGKNVCLNILQYCWLAIHVLFHVEMLCHVNQQPVVKTGPVHLGYARWQFILWTSKKNKKQCCMFPFTEECQLFLSVASCRLTVS